jgi:hypothetical protein
VRGEQLQDELSDWQLAQFTALNILLTNPTQGVTDTGK